MTGFAVTAFKGAMPRTSERLLAFNQAGMALNCKIGSGRLDPLAGLGLIHTSDAAIVTTMWRYRFGDVYNWLVSEKVVDFVRSPTAQDALGRFYYTGDGEPRMSTYADAITGPGPYPAGWYTLGVAFPVTAPTVTPVGGTGTDEERTYVYTFKNRYGEESGPSPQKTATGKPDASWDLSAMDVAPPNSGTIVGAVKDTPVAGQTEVELNSVFGLAIHEELNFAGVTGMTDLNGKFAIISINTTTKKVVVALATTQTYIAGADTWTREAPHNLTDMVKVIYRTIGTNTDYKFVAEIPVADTTYSDTIPSTTVSLAAGITTLDNFPPPKNLHSVILLANGCLAGLDGNEFCMSEQGKPYSWPIAYRQTFPGTGIGMVPAGNSAIILTDSFPLVATATVPESLTITKIDGDTLAPCVAKRSIVDIGSGAIFASHDGLYIATASSVTKFTERAYTFNEWKYLYPETFIAGFHDQCYYAMHATQSGEQDRIFMMSLKEPDSVVEATEQVDSIYGNPWDGRLYVSQGNKILQWDSDNANRYTMFWLTQTYQTGKPLNLSCAQVQAKYSDIVPINTVIYDANAALLADPKSVNGATGSRRINRYGINRSALRPVPQVTAGSVQYTLLQNGVPVYTKQVTSKEPFRLPGLQKSDDHSMIISSNIPIYSINSAQGMNELKAAQV